MSIKNTEVHNFIVLLFYYLTINYKHFLRALVKFEQLIHIFIENKITETLLWKVGFTLTDSSSPVPIIAEIRIFSRPRVARCVPPVSDLHPPLPPSWSNNESILLVTSCATLPPPTIDYRPRRRLTGAN